MIDKLSASEGDPQAREDTWMAEECRMAPLPPHEWHDGRCIYCDEEERETRSTDDDVHEKGTVVARETSAPAKPTVGTNEGTGLEGRSGKPDAAEPLLPATSSVSPMVEALGPVAWLEQAESLSPRADPPKRKRVFIDAHPFFRCTATVVLSDKTTAQCGRRYNDDVRLGSGRLLCAQHAAMDPAKVKQWRS